MIASNVRGRYCEARLDRRCLGDHGPPLLFGEIESDLLARRAQVVAVAAWPQAVSYQLDRATDASKEGVSKKSLSSH